MSATGTAIAPSRSTWAHGCRACRAFGAGHAHHQVAYPLLIGPNAYVVLFVLATFMGAAITRRAKARWPGISRMDRCPKSAMPHLRNDKQNGGAGVGDLETKYPAQFSSRCS